MLIDEIASADTDGHFQKILPTDVETEPTSVDPLSNLMIATKFNPGSANGS